MVFCSEYNYTCVTLFRHEVFETEKKMIPSHLPPKKSVLLCKIEMVIQIDFTG